MRLVTTTLDTGTDRDVFPVRLSKCHVYVPYVIIKCILDKTSSDRLVIMGIGYQGVGRMHECFFVVFTEKALFSIPTVAVAIFR